MSRFDQLEMRMDASDRRINNLEVAPLYLEIFSEDDEDSDDREYRAYRETYMPHRG